MSPRSVRIRGPVLALVLITVLAQALSAAGVQTTSYAGAVRSFPPGAEQPNNAESGVVLPNTSTYYWSGDFLNIDGVVYNDSAFAFQTVTVEYLAQSSLHGIIAVQSNNASTYWIDPGEYASFKCSFYLPDYTELALYVSTDATGYQTSSVVPVDLTLVSNPSRMEAGLRIYSPVYRNDTPYTVEKPIIGGAESDGGGNLIDTVSWFENIRIPPGGVWSPEVVAFNPYAVVGSVWSYCQALPVTLMPVYRFYNVKTGVHFYTASEAEKASVIANLGHIYKYEGVSYQINVANPVNSQSLHRFYNAKAGVHFYTASESEKASVIANLSHIYKYEGVAYKVSLTPTTKTVWRFYNFKKGVHFYTADPAEKANVEITLAHTYKLDGIGYYIGQ